MPFLQYSHANRQNFMQKVSEALSVLNYHFVAAPTAFAAAEDALHSMFGTTFTLQPHIKLQIKPLPCQVPDSVIPDCRIEYQPPRSTTVVNKISVSFSPEACKAVQIASLSTSTLDNIAAHMLTFTKQEKVYWSSIRKDFGAQVNFINDKTTADLLGTSKLSEKNKQLALYTMHTMECFAGIDFDFHNMTHPYKISLCNLAHLTDKTGFAGYRLFANDGGSTAIGNSSVIFLDIGSTQVAASLVGNPIYDTNTIAHELMHALGFDHAQYQNLQDNRAYPSIIDDAEHISSFVIQHCKALAIKLATSSTAKNKDAYLECLNTPAELQPLDVAALMEKYGPSQDQSVFCQTARHFFAELHPSEMEVVAD